MYYVFVSAAHGLRQVHRAQPGACAPPLMWGTYGRRLRWAPSPSTWRAASHRRLIRAQELDCTVADAERPAGVLRASILAGLQRLSSRVGRSAPAKERKARTAREYVQFNLELRTLRWGWSKVVGIDQVRAQQQPPPPRQRGQNNSAARATTTGGLVRRDRHRPGRRRQRAEPHDHAGGRRQGGGRGERQQAAAAEHRRRINRING